MFKRSIILVGMTILLSIKAVGGTYYVATNGNDSAAGSTNTPWATLPRASQNLVPGDTVIVRAGKYAGLYFNKNGAPGAPISFLADPGVTITNRNSTNGDGIDLEGCSYITIDGFTVINPLGTNGISRACIRSCSNGTSNDVHVIIRRCIVSGGGNYGIFTSHSDYLLIESNDCSGSILQHGIYVSNACTSPTLRGNRSYDNCGCGMHFNGDISQGGSGLISNALIECNIIYNNGLGGPGVAANGGSGINCDGLQDSIIRNNLLFNNHGSGISLFQTDAAQSARRDIVVNNTIVQASDAKWCLNINSGSTSNTVFNNILYNNYPSSVRGSITLAADSLPGFKSDYNCVMDRFTADAGKNIVTLAQWQTNTAQDAHSMVSTPAQLFANASASNYLLCAGSPAIDAGTNALNSQATPVNDLTGYPRPIGGRYDIGAYEFLVTLTVFSANGTATPVPGVYLNGYHAFLTNFVNSTDTQGGTQYVATGWILTGNLPASGTTTNCTLTLTNNAVLTWQWQTNYWLAVAGTNGSASPSNAWEGYGSNVLVTATPSNYYAFACWSGQTNGGVISNNYITLTMSSARTVQALFAPLLATDNVPQWWLAQYGWTNNFNAAVMADADGDGLTNWQEYLTGTDPTNRASTLTVTGVDRSQAPLVVVRWSSVTNRYYAVYRSTNLIAGAGGFVALSSNIPGRPPMNVYTDRVSGAGATFYRIDVHP